MKTPEETGSRDANEPGLPDLTFSLLWPEGRKASQVPLRQDCIADLGLDALVPYFTVDRSRQEHVRSILTTLVRDDRTLRFRQDVLEDLLANEPLIRCFEELVPVVGALRYFVSRPQKDDWTPFQETVFRLRELEHYVKSIGLLSKAFRESGSTLGSEGLRELSTLMDRVESDPTYMKLLEALPELLTKIDRIRSISIGVNLNGALQPYEATLLSIDSKEYTDGGFYNKLIGRDEWKGIAPLHSSNDSEFYANPLMVPLFRDIAQIMNRTAQPVASALKAFVSINSRLFVKLQDEFLFFLGAVRLTRAVRAAGLPMCRPELLPEGERRLEAEGLYNLALALRMQAGAREAGRTLSESVVANDFSMNDSGRIVILTGPNRGGKTTFLQALGLAQILLQAGVYVPASSATMSPSDAVFTHYPALEVPEKGTGRFGEEAERLKVIFRTATRNSLILMNESLSSTSMGESLYLAMDLLRVYRRLGCRVAFATHLHQLAADVERINADTDGDSRLISMVSTIEEVTENGAFSIRPTFRIVIGPPAGQSYALELAVRFGISRDQLMEELSARLDSPLGSVQDL